jgi:hypothetical protein
MTQTNIGILSVGLFLALLAASLVIAIIAYLRSTVDISKREEKTKRLIVGREYMVNDSDGHWFTGIYMGMDLDGWREFSNFNPYHGVSIKSKRPESLFDNGDVKWLYAQSPLPEREYDRKTKNA